MNVSVALARKGPHVGKKLLGVRLALGPAQLIVADLDVRLLRPFRTFLLGEQVQIGCSFASMSLAMQQSLERFLTAGQPGRPAPARQVQAAPQSWRTSAAFRSRLNPP